MDVRIGITQSMREIELELDNDTDRAALKAQVAEAVATEAGVLWLTDVKGREVAVPASKIAFVEIGHDEDQRSIGFSA